MQILLSELSYYVSMFNDFLEGSITSNFDIVMCVNDEK